MVLCWHAICDFLHILFYFSVRLDLSITGNLSSNWSTVCVCLIIRVSVSFDLCFCEMGFCLAGNF